MALITDYCHACMMLRPCDCQKLALGFKSSTLPDPEEQKEHNRRMSDLAETMQVAGPAENVVSLSAERFKRDTNPQNHSPRAALERAIEFFDSMPSNRNATHAIVIFATKTEEGYSGTRFIQAGALDYHGQMGLVAEAQCLMREAE